MLNNCFSTVYKQFGIIILWTILVFGTTSPLLILAQTPNIGIPPIFHYEKTTYHGGTQSWESSILENGNIVFANNDGLLVFDGSTWKTHRLPKKTICRSISISQDSRIYVGGQDEVGFFSPDKNGELHYSSIRERIQKKDLPIDDIWNFVSEGKNQYFRSNEKIFFDNRKDSIYSVASFPTITNLSKVDEIVYFAVFNEGLFKVQNGKVSRCADSNISDITITSMCSYENGLLLGTLKDGLFHYSNDKIKPLKVDYQSFLLESRILQVYETNQKKIVIATERNGVVIANSSLQAVHHINKIKGLQNNIVRTVHEDHAGSIWVGTGNGIDQILLQDGTQVFYPDGEEQGSIYDILEFKGKYYFATGNGLYFLEKKDQYDAFQKGSFQLVKNSMGQVWGVDTIDGQLLMGHIEGAFVIKGDNAVKISPTNSGTWKFEKLNDSILVAGTYFGLDFYTNKNDDLKFIANSQEFKESSRIIEVDHNMQIWVSHPYRGVYKINVTPSLRLEIRKYGKGQGLYSDYLNYVFQYQEGIIVTSEVGIYSYEEKLDSFVKKQEWTKLIGAKTNVRRLFPLDDNQVIYSTATHIGKLLQSSQIGDPAILLQKWTQHAESLVKGFEFIYPMNEESFFLASDKGVIIHSLGNRKSEKILSVRFNNIKIIEDTITEVYNGFGTVQQGLKLEPNQNTIQFTYSSNMVNPYQPTEFRFWLEGIENNWSSWNVDQYKDYTGLRTGQYTFHIQARNDTHGKSEIGSYSFTVKPNWYESKLAFILYSIFALFGLLVFSIFVQKRYRNEAVVLKEEQKLSQEEIERLKNEKLESELQYRNKELASSTMHLVQKNETITKIKQELDGIYQKVKDAKIRRELRKAITLINDNDRLEGEWENFAMYFDQVHTNFLKRLNKKFPELSSKDLKLAAYLRMNLTTKEIAPLLNISIRGVEISRYRLRKKLALETETNLNEYMMNF